MATKPAEYELPLVLAIAEGQTLDQAAKAAGISKRTVARRLADRAFVADVRRVRASMLERVAGLLADACSEAVSTLRELLSCESNSTRCRAALGLLDQSIRVADATEVNARLELIERQLRISPNDSAARLLGGMRGGNP